MFAAKREEKGYIEFNYYSIKIENISIKIEKKYPIRIETKNK